MPSVRSPQEFPGQYKVIDIQSREDKDKRFYAERQGTAIVVIQHKYTGEVMFAEFDYWHNSVNGTLTTIERRITIHSKLDMSLFEGADKLFFMEDVEPISTHLVLSRVINNQGPLGLQINDDDFDATVVKSQNTFMGEVIKSHNLVIVDDKFFPLDGEYVKKKALNWLEKQQLLQKVE